MESENKKENIQKPTRPINYEQKFDNLFRSKKYETHYIRPLINEIENTRRIPAFRFKLEDLDDDNLFNLFKKNLDNFFDKFREGLFKRLTFEPLIKEIFEEKNFESKELHIIPDFSNFEFLVSEINDFSMDMTDYVDKIAKISAKYMNIGLDKHPYYKKIKYFCSFCGTKFDKNYPFGKIFDSINTPSACMKKKCGNRELESVKYNTYEIGSFIVEDLDLKSKRIFKQAYIFRNIKYFIEKLRDVNINEELEILGILRIDYTKLGKRGQIPDYFIEVIDIKLKKENKIDENIVMQIKNKIQKDPFYFEKIIDSINDITFLVDNFFPIKLFVALSFITGGARIQGRSKSIRDTINSLVGGESETYKSSTLRAFQKIVGERTVFLTEVLKISHSGLFGTTERKPDKKTPDIRYGVVGMYSDSMACFDEVNKKPDLILEVVSSVEAGFYMLVLDAMKVPILCQESLVLFQNFVMNEDGSYNFSNTLVENLGWKSQIIGPILERIDYFYIVPKSDVFTQLLIDKNDDKIDDGIMVQEIAEILEVRDFKFQDKNLSLEEKIFYIQKNYFYAAKETYRKTIISNEEKEIMREFRKQTRQSVPNLYKLNDGAFRQRGKTLSKRSLRAAAALRLSEITQELDFQYFKETLINYILPYRDSKIIKKNEIDIKKIFKKVFKRDIINNNEVCIDLKDLMTHLKVYIYKEHFADKSIEDFEEIIKSYLGEGNDLSNYKFNKILKNNEIWLNKKGYFIESKRGKGNLSKIKKEISN